MPAVIGHEGAGVVEQVGPDVTNVAPGDHVILSWLPYCGACCQCLRGRANLCERLAWSDSGTMMDGTVRLHRKGRDIHHYTTSSFAELAVVPAQTAIKVDDDLPLTELALMGCAVMTGVGAVLNTAKVRPGDSVAVVGCGGVGLNIVQGAAIAAASRIVAIDMEPVKLDLARELGATETILASDGRHGRGRDRARRPRRLRLRGDRPAAHDRADHPARPAGRRGDPRRHGTAGRAASPTTRSI